MATTCMDPRIRRKPIRSMLVNWVPRKIHVSRALDTGSTVTKRLAFTLPRMLMPRPYIVNGMREPTMATASEAAIILPSM